jgi:hypothetical protein
MDMDLKIEKPIKYIDFRIKPNPTKKTTDP